ncbi:CLUMA_CG003798, isoform A [Clunio marinus]|uniref:CLUMA_CG003798, isoform A n=2 Tax=Clunio marinus TaxID=568069 RepID=A0A1J1HPV0_9DIPT|nr:CLUMA_CG003798, isoform A [Clunio marinus]
MSEDATIEAQNKIDSVVKEIDFGYHHVNESFVVFPGPEDTTEINFSSDGNFINHKQSVTLVVRAGGHQIPFLCWILLVVLLLSVAISVIVVCCFYLKQRSVSKRKLRSRIATHINGFQSCDCRHLEMLPKYVAQPAQSYSTQKLYQWCQQKEMQQYKSLWAVNPNSSGPSSSIIRHTERTENPNAYKTRSLPSKHKQRPVTSIEDLDELYSKVNISKKLRNRMTNDEAAIIAFCRSKSQNLSQFTGNGPKGDDAIVIYDERTAL